MFEQIEFEYATGTQEQRHALQEWLLAHLHQGSVQVLFVKANGEERVMTCTLSEVHGRPQQPEKVNESKKIPNPEVCAVWDCAAQAWRSFRWDRLKGVKILDG